MRPRRCTKNGTFTCIDGSNTIVVLLRALCHYGVVLCRSARHLAWTAFGSTIAAPYQVTRTRQKEHRRCSEPSDGRCCVRCNPVHRGPFFMIQNSTSGGIGGLSVTYTSTEIGSAPCILHLGLLGMFPTHTVCRSTRRVGLSWWETWPRRPHASIIAACIARVDLPRKPSFAHASGYDFGAKSMSDGDDG
jgi:hypothetical protein